MCNPASDHAVAMQTVERDWDGYVATFYTDWSATHSNANGGSNINVTTGPTSDTRVSLLLQPADGAHPSKLRRMLYKRPSTWYRRMSSSTRYASVLQHMQNLLQCRQVDKPDEEATLQAKASPTESGCHLTFTW